MVVQIEDCNNCLQHVFPQLEYEFELDHSRGHNAERPGDLSTITSVINLGWGSKQRKMRSSVLSKDEVGTSHHAQRIATGDTQSMIILEDNLPPIFDPRAAKYDEPIKGETITMNLLKGEFNQRGVKRESTRAWVKL